MTQETSIIPLNHPIIIPLYIYIYPIMNFIYIYISPLYPHCHHVLKMAKWFQQHLQVSRHRGVHVDQDLARRGLSAPPERTPCTPGICQRWWKMEISRCTYDENVRDDGKYMISRCTYWIYIWIWILLNKICAVSEYISPYVHIII